EREQGAGRRRRERDRHDGIPAGDRPREAGARDRGAADPVPDPVRRDGRLAGPAGGRGYRARSAVSPSTSPPPCDLRPLPRLLASPSVAPSVAPSAGPSARITRPALAVAGLDEQTSPPAAAPHVSALTAPRTHRSGTPPAVPARHRGGSADPTALTSRNRHDPG